MGLGDAVHDALSAVGVTPEWVEARLGRPCNCEERRAELNALGFWAKRVLNGKLEGAKKYLDRILGAEQ